MNIFKYLFYWRKTLKNSDIKYIKITNNGSFHMQSKHLFKDKKEALELLNKINEYVDKNNNCIII